MTLHDDEILRMVREAMPAPHTPDPDADLWPRVRRGVEERWPSPGVTDWLLAAAATALCLARPDAIRLFLFHL